MKMNAETSIPDQLNCAAFYVVNNIITQVNDPAIQRQIPLGANIHELINTGSKEYNSFRSGKLYLQISVAGIRYNACVSRHDDGYLFWIPSDYSSKELQLLALISSIWKEPLQNAMIGLEQLSMKLSESNDPSTAKSIGQINRNLYQLIRSVGNMSNASASQGWQASDFQLVDVKTFFEEIESKLRTMISADTCTIQYAGLAKTCHTIINANALERAVYNLISNAIKFSPKSSEIKFKVSTKGNQIYISVENTCDTNSAHAMQFFDRYLREPGLEESRYGIGLGLSVIRNVAHAHHGTLLVSRKSKNIIAFTMTLAIQKDKSAALRSPLNISIDHSGGLDPALIELSEILPDDMYEII